MKTRFAILLLLLPALLLWGCDPGPGDVTLPTEPTAPNLVTLPEDSSVPETGPVLDDPETGCPYGVIAFNGGQSVLLYDDGCDFDQYGGHMYQAILLSSSPVDMDTVTLEAVGPELNRLLIQEFSWDANWSIAEEERDLPYVRASLKGIDWYCAAELYRTWKETEGEADSIREAAWSPYWNYLHQYGMEAPGDSRIPHEESLYRDYYVYDLYLYLQSTEEAVAVDTLRFTVGQEQFAMPIGEIRLHKESPAMEDNDALSQSFAMGSGEAGFNREKGTFEGVMGFQTKENLILNGIQLPADCNVRVEEIWIEQTTGDGQTIESFWSGGTPFYIYAGEQVYLRLVLHDPRMVGNDLFQSAIQYRLHYTSAQGQGTIMWETRAWPAPAYLYLCAAHLDQVDFSGYWAYEAQLQEGK